MKYTLICINLNSSTLAGAKDYLRASMAQAGEHGVAIAADILLFKTKEASTVIHNLTGYLMHYSLPFVSLQTEGPITAGLLEDQYPILEKLGVDVHKLALGHE